MADKSLPWGLKNDKITPGSVKAIPESKLKAFEIGTMNIGKKSLSKREQEELKKKEDEKRTAEALEDFVASFQDSGRQQKMWVKGGTVNPGAGKHTPDGKPEKKKQIYKPTSKLAELAATFQSVKKEQARHEENSNSPSNSISYSAKKPKRDEKKKSQLEQFKEELKQIQREREERHRIKKIMRGEIPPDPEAVEPQAVSLNTTKFEPLSLEDKSDDPWADPYSETTTNIYLKNLNPKMSEQQLCELFGRYGPLASVKIMWPRTDEERGRGRNCGFVAFMSRNDGDRAMDTLKGKDVMGYEMKLGWGKSVPIPPHPVYIPPALAELTQPPPPSGLPFNAQPHDRRHRRGRGFGNIPPSEKEEDMDKILAKAVVKVVIPTERNLLCVIHRMIEFVVREGPMFEAMIMNREISNPMFRFLFDNQSPAHLYYRWKLFSILQGDTPYNWRTEEYKMFKGGSTWRPPIKNVYTQGMPEHLIKDANFESQSKDPSGPKKGSLTDSQRDRLEDMLRDLTPERPKIGDGMVWCLDHAEAGEEIVECITESLSILQTPIPKKIARLFLVSDILFNSSAKVPNASFFRKCFQSKLRDIFKDIHETYINIDGRLKAEQFKQKVMGCFKAWEDWTVYPNDYLINLQNIFLGLVPNTKVLVEAADSDTEDLDGAPLDDNKVKDESLDGKPLEDLDGDPLGGDVDGTPMGEDLDGKPLESESPARQATPPSAKFVKSKWEAVDETELEAQAMTTSKWDLLEQENEDKQPEEMDEDIDGLPLEEGDDSQANSDEESSFNSSLDLRKHEMTEERRAKLREIEVKVMKYQDELEMGKRSRKSHMSLQQQTEHYRKKLLQKETTDSPREGRKRHRSRSMSPAFRHIPDSPKRSKKSKSPKRSRKSRSRSRTPRRRSSSRSPSRHRHKHKKNKYRD